MENHMWSLGFGLERLGLLALRFPRLFTLLMIIGCVFAGYSLTSLKFDGNVTAVLPEDSQAYNDFFKQKRQYRDSARDIAMIVRSDRLMTAEGLEDLRSLQLDISLSDGVENISSLFSVPKPDPRTGAIANYFPETIESDEQAKSLVKELLESQPQASALIVPEDNVAVIRLSLQGAESNREAYRVFRNLREEANSAKPEDFEVLFTGITPLGLTIVEALISDQMKLTLIGLILGTCIGLYVFRSFLAAIVCAVPPMVTALSTLALFAATNTPLNYLSTILPTLGLILAFADGIVLYYRWQSSNVENDDFVGNLAGAIKRVGPASALTSVTTALAFFSFSFSSSTALKDFAYLGMGAVTTAFIAVIIGLPLAIYWAIKMGAVKSGKVKQPAFANLGKVVHKAIFPRPFLVSSLAILFVIVLGYIHTLIQPEYRITDYLPANSDASKAEAIANKSLEGGSMMFLSLPLENQQELFATENLDKLSRAEEALGGIFGPNRVLSINAVFKQLETDEAIAAVADELENANDIARSNFVSKDNANFLVSVRLPSNQSIAETAVQVEKINSELAKQNIEDTTISGLPVLMSAEFTTLIEQLRTSLLIAIGLGVLVIGIATRSPLMAIAAITPNLVPILMVEFVIYLEGGAVNLSQVISLTVAFGIAIDNAVHVINVLDEARRQGLGVRDGIRSAMNEVGPALGASTLIICVSTLVTQLSIMPMVPTLGKLMITTLIIALISNLAILPANVLSMRELMPNLIGRKARKASN